jgi:transposase-like protein
MADTQNKPVRRLKISKARRSYTNDYKIAAVKFLTEKGVSCAEAGRRQGINPI